MMTPTEFSSRLQRDPLDAVLEVDHLAGHDAGEAVDAGDAVADLEHLADLGPRDLGRGTARFHAE